MEPGKRKTRRLSKRDFFELLPDDLIISHILPRVGTMKSIARLSMVSRRFNRLCVWTQNVDFSEQTRITDKMAGYLDKFFDFRTNSTDLKYNIRRLNLRDPILRNLTCRKMIKWIQQASSLNLEELFIERLPGPHSCRFLFVQNPSKFLRIRFPFVQFPSKSLRILSLKNVKLKENKVIFDDWLLNCECLEELYLTNIIFSDRELKISSSTLRVLSVVAERSFDLFCSAPKVLRVSAPKLRNSYVVWEHDRFWEEKPSLIRVLAPNLENFSLVRGNVKRATVLDYCSSVESFPCLQSATISFYRRDRVLLDSMLALLHDISQLRSLRVNIGFIRQCSVLELPLCLDKLENLHIFFSRSGRYKRLAKAIKSFLKDLPLIKTLKFTSFGGRGGRHYRYRSYRFLNRNKNCNEGRDQQKFLRSLECDSSKFGISKVSVCTEANLVAEIQLRKGRRGRKLALHIIRHAPKDSQITVSYPSQD